MIKRELRSPFLNKKEFIKIYIKGYRQPFFNGPLIFRYHGNLYLHNFIINNISSFHKYFIYHLHWHETLYIDYKDIPIKAFSEFFTSKYNNSPLLIKGFHGFRIIERVFILKFGFMPRYIVKNSSLLLMALRGYDNDHCWTIYRIRTFKVNNMLKLFCIKCEELYWVNKFFLPMVIDT